MDQVGTLVTSTSTRASSNSRAAWARRTSPTRSRSPLELHADARQLHEPVRLARDPGFRPDL